MFATARLADTVTHAGELPRVFGYRNGRGVPSLAVISLGVLAAALAVIGGLSQLVEAASLTFLFTFATVNVMAVGRLDQHRWISVSGAVGAAGATVVLVVRLARNEPLVLIALVVITAAALLVRPREHR